jgi:hypothetical protein
MVVEERELAGVQVGVGWEGYSMRTQSHERGGVHGQACSCGGQARAAACAAPMGACLAPLCPRPT